MRLRNIDFLKGILIILVLMGHMIQGQINTSISRYLIYSFHMPLFIGISGFLFNIKKTEILSMKELYVKYKFRIIIPWIVAVLAYIIIYAIIKPNHSEPLLLTIIKSFISPYYHLWFIPGFLSWVFITWAMKKIGMSIENILWISFIISFIFFILKLFPVLYEKIPVVNSFMKLILHTFRLYFYVFFVLGITYRKSTILKIKKIEILVPLFLFAITVFLFYNPNNIITLFCFYLFNLSLLNISIKISKKEILPSVKIFEWMGQNSMGIYLWHIIPILITKKFFFKEDITIFYVLAIIFELVFVLLFAKLTKIKIINKYLFGM